MRGVKLENIKKKGGNTIENQEKSIIFAFGNGYGSGYAAHIGFAGICGATSHPDQNLERHRNANLYPGLRHPARRPFLEQH